MNTEVTPKTEEQPEFVAYVGLDWGDASHAVALRPLAGKGETGTLVNSPEVLHAWLHKLGQRFAGGPVALAVETSRGPLIHVFMAYPWLTVYPIHPATSARYRAAFTPSGAKNDEPDAAMLEELVRCHRDKLRPLQPPEVDTRKLAALVELRRDLVDRRTQVVLQLTSLLKTYYPQALILAGEKLSAPMALDFLRRWPDLLNLKASRPSTLVQFYYRHSVRSESLVQARLGLVKQAVALTTDEAVLAPARFHLRVLLDQITLLNKYIKAIEIQIDILFINNNEAYLYKHLPGAGAALQPRLLVAFGEDRSLYPDPGSFQKYAGLAPVTEKSGDQCWIHWRWFACRFLRQTMIEWAAKTVHHSGWAKAYYEAMAAKGKGHQVIVRALAFKWARILWKCWKTRTPYDESRYLQSLARRQSPYAVANNS
jgi:transposase